MAVLGPLFPVVAQGDHTPNTIAIDATKPAGTPPAPLPRMGGTSRSGHEIGVNSQYLTLDGKPWLPVMGEFHYSRYPEQYWEEELLKMKAGGVQIVSTYVFWIHQQEIEGEFDWTRQRNLRDFVELCAKRGLYVFLRIGPYAHGEVRNGGLPDWLVAHGVTRKNNPQYLSYVRRYFAQIGQQVKGFFWKDGGPIIGVQLENEYSQRGPDAGAAHISELKKIARESGLDAPIYTVTGWDNPDFPAGEVIPVFGGYADDFWESTLTELPPSGYYLFEAKRDLGDVGAGTTPQETSSQQYPFFMAEAGGGMQVAYHRRPVITGDDVAAMTLTRLRSGANLYGYYMYQGGANPAGKRTSLQESVETDHVYDLPEISYDFQAPLGEFGQMNPAFRATKVFHLFLNDFGSYLAPMVPVLPQLVPATAADQSTVRLAARIRGSSGFIFLNNYQRNYSLPDHPDVRVQLALPGETLLLPRRPLDIPSSAYVIWPVNLDLNGVLLKYATAQLLTKISHHDEEYYFFFAQPGIRPEFSFDENSVASLRAGKATISHAGGRIFVGEMAPGPGVALSVRSKSSGKMTHIILLSKTEAQDVWKVSIAGQERIVLSPADVFFAEDNLYLRARNVEKLRFSVFPFLSSGPVASVPLRQIGLEGVFAAYFAKMHSKKIDILWQKIREADAAAPARMGKYNAIAPKDADFEHAGVWKIALANNAAAGLSDVFLRIDYTGDVARLYSGRRLLADDFYKGTLWEIGLKRFAPEAFGEAMSLKIMPLRKDAPIYIPASLRPPFPPSGETSKVSGITGVPEYEVRVSLR